MDACQCQGYGLLLILIAGVLLGGTFYLIATFMSVAPLYKRTKDVIKTIRLFKNLGNLIYLLTLAMIVLSLLSIFVSLVLEVIEGIF